MNATERDTSMTALERLAAELLREIDERIERIPGDKVDPRAAARENANIAAILVRELDDRFGHLISRYADKAVIVAVAGPCPLTSG